MKLEGANVLLTGASGGIGHAIARELARRGARLTLTARRTEIIEALAAEVGGSALAADLSMREDTERLIAGCADADVLVANAALPASGPLLGFEPDEIVRAIEVNLTAPALLARGLGGHMVARGHGHVVFISSLAGKSGQPGSALYSATKFGLRGLAQGLRGDLAAAGVGVSAVFPGFIRDAGMFADSGVKLPKGVGTNTPEEVALAVVKAIEQDRGEVDVAPVAMRVGSAFASVAPATAARAAKLLGGDRVADSLAGSQSGKR